MVATDCSSVNNTVMRFDDVVASLSARLNSMQAVINETLVSNCCMEGCLHAANVDLCRLSVVVK